MLDVVTIHNDLAGSLWWVSQRLRFLQLEYYSDVAIDTTSSTSLSLALQTPQTTQQRSMKVTQCSLPSDHHGPVA